MHVAQMSSERGTCRDSKYEKIRVTTYNVGSDFLFSVYRKKIYGFLLRLIEVESIF